MFRMIPQTNVALTASFEARIYAASGGSPNLPTGSPLAVSAPVTWEEIRAMSNAGNLEIPFTFDGTFQVQQGTNYYVCVAAISGPLNTTNYMWTYYSAVNTALNSVRFRNNVWANNSSNNLYFSVIGSTSSGGGSTPDWNNVPHIHLKGDMYLDNPTQFIKIDSHPTNLNNWNAVLSLLRTLNFTPPSSHIEFASLDSPNYATSLFQVNLAINDVNTSICCTHHFMVRKDLHVNGMLSSLEGEVVLHSGKYNNSQMRTWGTLRKNLQNPQQPFTSYRPIIQAANFEDLTVQAIDFVGTDQNDAYGNLRLWDKIIGFLCLGFFHLPALV